MSKPVAFAIAPSVRRPKLVMRPAAYRPTVVVALRGVVAAGRRRNCVTALLASLMVRSSGSGSSSSSSRTIRSINCSFVLASHGATSSDMEYCAGKRLSEN